MFGPEEREVVKNIVKSGRAPCFVVRIMNGSESRKFKDNVKKT